MSPVKLIECHPDFLIAIKPAGIHSAPLQVQDASALQEVVEHFPEVGRVRGKKSVEGGLVHRIDYDTAGLLLFARNQEFYNHIINCQERNLFKKEYMALCNYEPQCPQKLGSFPPSPQSVEKLSLVSGISFVAESAFRPYGPGRKQVRPVTGESGKFSQQKVGKKTAASFSTYSTQFRIKKIEGKNFFIGACLTRGYRHQVRCHLAWCGLPIVGDPLYNPSCKVGDKTVCVTVPQLKSQMQFFATGLQFPIQNEKLLSTTNPDFPQLSVKMESGFFAISIA